MEENSGKSGQKSGPKQPGVGPRGAGGRGGRGGFYFKPKELKGQVEGLPVLNFYKSSMSSDELYKWIAAMKTYTMTNFIIGLDDIFLGNEAAAYPVFEEPEFPDEEIQTDRIVMKVWEMEYKDYKENSKKLEEHKSN